MAVDPNIKKKADDIRNKIYGKEVRGALAGGLELMSSHILANVTRQETVEGRQDIVESQWQSVVDATTEKDVISAPEIIAARGTHNNLSERMHLTDQQLAENSVKIRGIRSNFKEKRASFCLIDDDINERAYTYLKPLLDSKGMKGTIAYVTDWIGTPDRLTNSQVVEMYNDGWEIASHSVSHSYLSEISSEQLKRELIDSKQYLSDLGIKCETMVYPHGDYDEAVVMETQKHYKSAVTTYYKDNRTPLTTYGIGRLGIGPYGFDDIVTIKEHIDRAIKDNTICVLMTHVGAQTKEQDKLLEQTINYIISLGYDIMPYKEAYDYHQNLIDSGSYNEVDDKMEFSIGYDGSIGGVSGGYVTGANDSVKSDTPISEFKGKKVSTIAITSKNSNGFPSNAPGTLTTYKMASNDYAFQTYKISWGNQIHFRMWDHNNNSWGRWDTLNKDIMMEDDEVTSTTSPDSFSDGRIYHCKITWLNREGFPEEDQGYLITNTIGVGKFGTTRYQEYRLPFNHLIYSRPAISSLEWGEWQVINGIVNLPKDFATPSTSFTEFPKGQVSYGRIHSSSASGFPENKAGTLITYRITNQSYFTWQEYQVSESFNKYIRYWNPHATTWTSWRKYSMETV